MTTFNREVNDLGSFRAAFHMLTTQEAQSTGWYFESQIAGYFQANQLDPDNPKGHEFVTVDEEAMVCRFCDTTIGHRICRNREMVS